MKYLKIYEEYKSLHNYGDSNTIVIYFRIKSEEEMDRLIDQILGLPKQYFSNDFNRVVFYEKWQTIQLGGTHLYILLNDNLIDDINCIHKFKNNIIDDIDHGIYSFLADSVEDVPEIIESIKFGLL